MASSLYIPCEACIHATFAFSGEINNTFCDLALDFLVELSVLVFQSISVSNFHLIQYTETYRAALMYALMKVDTFFAISALLASIKMFKLLEK